MTISVPEQQEDAHDKHAEAVSQLPRSARAEHLAQNQAQVERADMHQLPLQNVLPSPQMHDFHAPFHGLAGAWRLMSQLRWGDPAQVLASMPERLTGLIAPTLIFHGRRDSAVPPAFATRAASLIPDSEVVLLDCGHFLPLSEPVTIASELLRFFTFSRSPQSQLHAAAD